MKRFYAFICLAALVFPLVTECGPKKEEPKIEAAPEKNMALEDTAAVFIDSTAFIEDIASAKEIPDEDGN